MQGRKWFCSMQEKISINPFLMYNNWKHRKYILNTHKIKLISSPPEVSFSDFGYWMIVFHEFMFPAKNGVKLKMTCKVF